MTAPFDEQEIIYVSTDNQLVKHHTSVATCVFVFSLNYHVYGERLKSTTIYHSQDLTDVTDFFCNQEGVDLFAMLYPAVNLELYGGWLGWRGLSPLTPQGRSKS